jgi:hypothetical protein
VSYISVSFKEKKKMGKKREEDETEGVDLFNRLAAKASGRLPLRFIFLFSAQ